jgi:hypothetical protein
LLHELHHCCWASYSYDLWRDTLDQRTAAASTHHKCGDWLANRGIDPTMERMAVACTNACFQGSRMFGYTDNSTRYVNPKCACCG